MKFKEMENFSTNEEEEDVNKTQRNLIKDDLINNVIKNRIKKEKKINFNYYYKFFGYLYN